MLVLSYQAPLPAILVAVIFGGSVYAAKAIVKKYLYVNIHANFKRNTA